MLDKNRYPDPKDLEKIAKWDIFDYGVENLLTLVYDNTEYAEPGGWCAIKRNGINYEYHTGGWSGNEEVIRALKDTWFWRLYWEKSIRGGHYYFKISPMIYGARLNSYIYPKVEDSWRKYQPKVDAFNRERAKPLAFDSSCPRTLHHNGGIHSCLRERGHEQDGHLFEVADVDTRLSEEERQKELTEKKPWVKGPRLVNGRVIDKCYQCYRLGKCGSNWLCKEACVLGFYPDTIPYWCPFPLAPKPDKANEAPKNTYIYPKPYARPLKN